MDISHADVQDMFGRGTCYRDDVSSRPPNTVPNPECRIQELGRIRQVDSAMFMQRRHALYT